MRPHITHPKAAVTTRATAALAAGCAGLLLALTGCGSPSAADAPSAAASGPASASGAKNGDTPPKAQSPARAGTARIPVPHGTGSRVPYDFNGDGHRDLVIDDLVKAPEDSHGDDAGIGVVYGSDDRPLDPAARQLLSARANAAKSGDTLPAAFDAESACDLDRDGFTDLIVSTDPPYNGIGAPPVPLQILFGSPRGLTGKAVTVRIPQKARFGNEWPEQPVCGDFDGDGRTDLAVTASAGRVTFLHGPFTRTGAPRSAELLPDGGPYLYAPEPRADTDGDGYDDLVAAARPHAPGRAAEGTLLLGSAKGPARPGGAYAFGAEELPSAPLNAPGATRTSLLDHGDYDADEKQDTVVQTYRGERQDLIALYTAGNTDRPVLTFSTALFLP
ncbi:FG-GAP repeat domain-containing protein [Streptomyces sp. NPDC102283]|uniref:FG-GAP repeat domain-containing protein n=1 Tax=Streptomyces sp. NPDC102283 TaxID=3366155 RepID=UPI00382FCBD5